MYSGKKTQKKQEIISAQSKTNSQKLFIIINYYYIINIIINYFPFIKHFSLDSLEIASSWVNWFNWPAGQINLNSLCFIVVTDSGKIQQNQSELQRKEGSKGRRKECSVSIIWKLCDIFSILCTH